jgi:hypothetical protein
MWGRLGISVAIVAIFSILMMEVLQGKAFYQVYRWAICAAMLAMGVFLLLVGGFVNARIRESRRDDEGGPTGPFLLVNLQYWGLMLTIFGIIVIFIVPYAKVEKVEARQPNVAKPTVAKKVLPPAVTNVTSVTNEPPPKPKPVVFPALKLQGIVSRGKDSSALINGRTYFVGNYVADVKVISITETSVVVELSGQQRELQLPP